MPTNYEYVGIFSAPSGGGRKVVNTTNNYHNVGNDVKGVESRLGNLAGQVEDLTTVMSQMAGGNKIYLGEIRKAEKELADLERIARV